MQRPAAARQLPLQLRITEAMLCAELGPGAGPLPVPVRTLGRFRSQQPFRCGAGAHGAQAAQPAAGSRCSSGAGGHGARAPAGAGERPGATGRGRRERPSGNARPAAARRTGGGRGAGAASATGGAVGTRKGWPRRGRWPGRQRCRLHCPRGAAIAGVPHRGGTRCRFAWAFRGAPRGLRRRPHLPKAHPTASRRRGRSPAQRAGAARAAGVACECGNGDPLLPVKQPLLAHPHRVAGGVQGGAFSHLFLLILLYQAVVLQHHFPSKCPKRKRGCAHWAHPLVFQ